MNIREQIRPFRQIIPMIYAYHTPGVSYHEGWTKIGYTEKQTVEERIKQQTHTANIRTELLWRDNAMYKDGSGEYFHDSDFHHFLTTEKEVKREKGTEWFEITGSVSRRYFNEFAERKYRIAETGIEYTLRKEQREAVDTAAEFYRKGGDEFLWNCKPRFGKTLSAYDLIKTMAFKHVMVVTNRPSIANSWAEDFRKFMAWRTPHMLFVSDSDALKGKEGVFTREQYLDYCEKQDYEDVPFLCFESLQNVKGSVYLGGKYDKLKWITEIPFDLLIVDESQEGVDTKKTDRAFKEIERSHTLYLSGTPFKQLAEGRFSESQIYNWTYADEQEAKEAWSGDGLNPYERLPRLSMFTYQISPMIAEEISRGIDLSEEHSEYAFDLNEFFSTNESGNFIHEEDVRKFLKALSTQEKYPFSTPELRKELAHTMWYMDRVSSVKAMEKLLKEDPVFHEYKVVVAAGNVKQNNEMTDEEDAKQAKAYDIVREAIQRYEKTITLTVGQLTVGVTIPEWSGVLMLCNLSSPSAYMQAAFRAQNPCSFTGTDGKRYEKETAYVFDFDPARTLIVYDQFANDLMSSTRSGNGTTEERKKNIKRLLNFFPVLGEDEEGVMVELDAAKVLSIPRRLKCVEVVRRGFMSNYLFANISNVYGAPKLVHDIISKLTPAQEEGNKKKKTLSEAPDISLDEDGNVSIPEEMVIGKSQGIFGEKIYENINAELEEPLQSVTGTITSETSSHEIDKKIDALKRKMKDTMIVTMVSELSEQYGMNKAQQKKINKDISDEVDEKIDAVKENYLQSTRIAEANYKNNLKEAETEEQVKAADEKLILERESAIQELADSLNAETKGIIQNKPKELVEKLETDKAEKERNSYDDEIRDHLRGFSRTIPSFLMAYGDRNLTLNNLDDYTEDTVFEEVTGISEENFRFLRDGGKRIDSETGEEISFKGHLFDEVVFNDSVQEFLDKKEKLANYFDEEQTEDIFSYIPPQKTNQIFTPRWVVEKMVDALEKENPGCFDNPKATFADLYMKSGLYIAEIVKRLYRSPKMKELYPSGKERIYHILEKQVYGMAPTRIIYLIATNYILGFDEDFKKNNPHFVEEDAAKAAKEGNLNERVDYHFGK